MSWGNPKTLEERVLQNAMIPLSLVLKMGSFLRKTSYSNNILHQTSLTKPVISVGNITCGGTGKTPMTIELARIFMDAGLKVGILSRGYKRKSKKKLVVVSDGCGNLASVEDAGDEPLLIASRLPKCVVIVGANRKATGTLAVEQFNCDLILLDDGMQHLPLHRDADIVLIDYSDEPQNDALLPAGRLREPLAALDRASSIVITKVPLNFEKKKVNSLKTLLSAYAPDAPIDLCRTRPSGLISKNGTCLPLTSLKGAEIGAFSGLASAGSFVESLNDLGANLQQHVSFEDHHWYSDEDVYALEVVADRFQYVITTEKDLIKFPVTERFKNKLYALQIELEWLDRVPAVIDEFTRKFSTAHAR